MGVLIHKCKYRGYDIVQVTNSNSRGVSVNYTILSKTREQTKFSLTSIKACKNVIDTYSRLKSGTSLTDDRFMFFLSGKKVGYGTGL